MLNQGIIRAIVNRCVATKARFREDGQTRCPVCDLAKLEHVRSKITSTRRDDDERVTVRTHQCPSCGLSFSSVQADREIETTTAAEVEPVRCTENETRRRRRR